MNFVNSQLSKPPYRTFSQFIFALNNHELRVSFYEDSKSIDHNLALVGVKGGRDKNRVRNPGSGHRSSNFNSQGKRFLPYRQCNGI